MYGLAAFLCVFAFTGLFASSYGASSPAGSKGAGRDTTICEGQSVWLYAEGGERYEWWPALSLDDHLSPTPLATPRENTRYRVLIFNGDSVDTAFVRVTVNPVPVADAGIDALICEGSSAALGSPGFHDYRYRWTPAYGLNDTTAANPVASPRRTMTYYLEVINENGCSGFDTVTIRVRERIVADAGKNIRSCPGEKVELTGKGGDRYTWFTEGGTAIAASQTVSLKPEKTTNYVLVVSDYDGLCTAMDTVTVEMLPVSPISLSKDTTILAGDTLQLYADGNNIVSWEWTPANGFDNPRSATPKLVSFRTERYTVTATNVFGCKTSQSILVTVLPRKTVHFSLLKEGRKPVPGDRIRLRLNFVSDQEGIDTFYAKINFDERYLRYVEGGPEIIYGFDRNWLFSTKEEPLGQLNIMADGRKGQKSIKSGEIAFNFDVFLSESYDSIVSLDIGGVERKGVRVTSVGTVLSMGDYCGDGTRIIRLTDKYYFLGEPVPNPPSDQATIKYGLALPGHLKIALYNALGKEVMEIFNGYSEAGTFSAGLSLGGLMPGSYICRLSSGNYNFSRNIMIVR